MSRLNATALTHRDPDVMQETSQKLSAIYCFYPGLVGFISVLGRNVARTVPSGDGVGTGTLGAWTLHGRTRPGALRKTLRSLRVSAANSKRRFSFVLRSSAARFALALYYSSAAEYPWEFKLRRISLDEDNVVFVVADKRPVNFVRY